MEKSNNQQMLNYQIIARGIKDRSVIEAMSKVPRKEFVPEKSKQRAYADSPLPIGYGQTISQPYIVAFMTEAAMLDKNSKVLEIGTGSGYQSAILAKLSKDVFTIEVIEPLGEQVKKRYPNKTNKTVKTGWSDDYTSRRILSRAFAYYANKRRIKN
jgi:protein-L-isoaspartate(D-aspartate) O-methyltransferase